MYKNVGRSIKNLATVIALLEIIGGSVVAILITKLFRNAMASLIVFLIIIGLSCLLAYLSTMFLYGYGELIDQSIQTNINFQQIINQNTLILREIRKERTETEVFDNGTFMEYNNSATGSDSRGYIPNGI